MKNTPQIAIVPDEIATNPAVLRCILNAAHVAREGKERCAAKQKKAA